MLLYGINKGKDEMKTIKDLKLHELTEYSGLPEAACKILDADWFKDDGAEEDAVTTALMDATKDYESKTAALLERHKDDRFQVPYDETLRIEHLYGNASINAGDTCEEYGIDADKDRWFYNYAFAQVELDTLKMEIDQHPIITDIRAQL